MGRTCDRCNKRTPFVHCHIVSLDNEYFDAKIQFIATTGGQDADICTGCGEELKVKLAEQIVKASKVAQKDVS